MKHRVSLAFIVATISLASSARAQELEPRQYSNLPIGLNFLLAGYAHSQGGLSIDPTLPIEDPRLKLDTGLLAYVRALDLWGLCGRFDVVVPWSHMLGTAVVAGQPLERDVRGFGDPRFRLSLNFLGAPALSLREYASYQPDLVVGASVQLGLPLGQYDATKALNLGTNRWSIKPDIGFSKALPPFTLDLTAGVTLFGRNNDFFGGQRVDQEPIYSTQANVTYDFGRGISAALGVTYYRGGRTTVNDVAKDNALNNSRTGLVVAFPIDRATSIKLNASTGVITRTGTNFDTVGLAFQYRWGAGL